MHKRKEKGGRNSRRERKFCLLFSKALPRTLSRGSSLCLSLTERSINRSPELEKAGRKKEGKRLERSLVKKKCRPSPRAPSSFSTSTIVSRECESRESIDSCSQGRSMTLALLSAAAAAAVPRKAKVIALFGIEILRRPSILTFSLDFLLTPSLSPLFFLNSTSKQACA